MTDLRIVHSSQQFSDTRSQHRHDAKALFDWAAKRGAVFVTGTEAGAGRNHDLRDSILQFGRAAGYAINAHKHGEWVAVNGALAEVVDSGFVGPLIPGTTGRSAAQGAHAPRGIAWATARVAGVGLVSVGAAHFLTNRSEKVSGSNAPLIAGIGVWGREAGKGRRLAFLNADVNEQDKTHDVFRGQPFTSCWDEVGRWPATHGKDKRHGSTIDVIASYDADRRAKCKAARVLDDSDLSLYTDHFVIEAVYAVAAKPPATKEGHPR